MSRKAQNKRFMERLDRPDKHWKFSASDVHERKFWGDCMHAFEEAIRGYDITTRPVVRGAG